MLLPWWPSLILAPGRILVGPDAALQGAPAAPEVWQLLLGREVGPGLPPLWVAAVVFGVVWAIALAGLVRRTQHKLVVAGWVTALLALAMAVVLSRLVVHVPPLGAEVRPWTGPYLLMAFGALLLGGAVGIDGFSRDIKRRSFSWLQPLAVLAGLAVALVTVGGAAWWVWAGVRGPVDRVSLEALPPYVRNAMVSESRARVLALDLSGSTARFSVLADRQLRLGDADRGGTFGGSALAQQQAQDLVVRLVAGTADSDIAPQLADLGVGYLWVRGAGEEERARIDNTPGLGAASGTDEGTVWQVEPPVSRSVVVDAGRAHPGDCSAVGSARRFRGPAAPARRGRGPSLAGHARRPAARQRRRRVAAGLRPAGGRGPARLVAALLGPLVPLRPGPRRGRGVRPRGPRRPAARGPRPRPLRPPRRHAGRGGLMSDILDPRYRDRRTLRRVLVVLALLVALAAVVVGGGLLRPQSAAPPAVPTAAVGRTSTVCTAPRPRRVGVPVPVAVPLGVGAVADGPDPLGDAARSLTHPRCPLVRDAGDAGGHATAVGDAERR